MQTYWDYILYKAKVKFIYCLIYYKLINFMSTTWQNDFEARGLSAVETWLPMANHMAKTYYVDILILILTPHTKSF